MRMLEASGIGQQGLRWHKHEADVIIRSKAVMGDPGHAQVRTHGWKAGGEAVSSKMRAFGQEV